MLKVKSRTMLVAFATVLTIAALTAAGASAALPEFAPSNHKYPDRFTFSSSEAKFEDAAGARGTCEGVRGLGSIVGPKEVDATMQLRNCKFGTSPCYNTTVGSEKYIQSVALVGTLGYVTKETKVVGLRLEPESKTAEFAQFKCGLLALELGRKLIGDVSPVNKLLKEFSLNYAQSKGVQLSNQLEGGLSGEQLHWTYSSEWEDWGLETSPKIATETTGEILA